MHVNIALPQIRRVSDIRMSSNTALEAWLYHFLTENNIEYLLNPSIVASPEQIRFMVALEDDQVYLPCDDELFFLIYHGKGAELSEEYLKIWRFVTQLVQSYDMTEEASSRVLALCHYRFNLFFAERMILPSRMAKRLLTIVLTQCGDPATFTVTKKLRNLRAFALLQDAAFMEIVQQCPPLDESCNSIPELRWKLYLTEMERLLRASTLPNLWLEESPSLDVVKKEMTSEDANLACLEEAFKQEGTARKKVLYIPDIAGGFVFDLAFVRSLQRQGHQVVLCLKDTFYFDTMTVDDLDDDAGSLKSMVHGLFITREDSLTKNELLRLVRENQCLVISDGLSEQLNLYRTSVTFSRAWKECDIVIAKGRRNKQLILDTSHKFTRDIICSWRDPDGTFRLELKPKAEWIRQFPEHEILSYARNIVASMREAREQGKTVMFYSAIIGSIPGQTRTALKVVNAFVSYLRSRLDNTFIINPAEHFVKGMDGDDLMFMWEFVQRSGLLDVWRFQTVEDIEKSFSLLKRKVPSTWSGKDSTFSTGCTKEMRIALDVQASHPELQIIGPSAERFFRRRDYGVGKYFDATLKG
ncbi:hypothetical protein LJC46_03020 [Desulfovibrio sp. OttesenSCG-928-G15]|nr:hypothetical protein [Desulfovibrio sp. OttesenSCG-928-G15]